MTGLITFLHAVISILLVVVILMQSGRGGGLTEGFASAESMFGAKTNEFMIKSTTVLSTIFLITCLGLAVVSAQKGKSLMSSQVASETQAIPAAAGDNGAIEEMEPIVIGDPSENVKVSDEETVGTPPADEIPAPPPAQNEVQPEQNKAPEAAIPLEPIPEKQN